MSGAEMKPDPIDDGHAKLREQLLETRDAARSLASTAPDVIAAVLESLAQGVSGHTAELLEANRRDLARMDANDPKYDRLRSAKCWNAARCRTASC